MQKALLRSLLVIVTICSAIVSCQHEPLDPKTLNIVRQLRDCDPDTIYFEKDIQPLLNLYCVTGCHDEVTSEDGVVLSSYSRLMATTEMQAGNPNESEIYKVITEDDENNRMPLSPRAPLAAADIELIRLWIQQGALNNSCEFDTIADTTSCVPSSISYATHVVPILQSNGCIGCHSGGNVILNNHGGTKAAAESGQLLKALKHLPGAQAMPQGALQPIDSCSIATIEAWINASYPNN